MGAENDYDGAFSDLSEMYHPSRNEDWSEPLSIYSGTGKTIQISYGRTPVRERQNRLPTSGTIEDRVK